MYNWAWYYPAQHNIMCFVVHDFMCGNDLSFRDDTGGTSIGHGLVVAIQLDTEIKCVRIVMLPDAKSAQSTFAL